MNGPGSPTRSAWEARRRPLLYAFSVIVIFLCVAALYESWPIPIANLLMLPLGLFGAALATWSRGMHNDVYFQIGFLTTLGLTTKNAILIIQFAQQRMAHGEGLIEATLGAARVRFRPVIMTSLAFFFGVLPLAIATGRRRRCHERHRHRRDRRDALRHLHRPLLHPAALCGRVPALRRKATPANRRATS